jgi:transcriptional adapter 2-alpha
MQESVQKESFVFTVGGKKNSYSCQYCKRDITQQCRIKCAECINVELCTDCFSVGVEFENHKNLHSYRISDCLDFPIFSNDWTVGEELLLLEGDSIYLNL